MPRGLDHIVHAVRDLDAAAEFYRRAGFTVGARNRHAWGTHNYIVQFPGVFIELISVGEPELIRIGAPGTFSFGAFTRDFLHREQGLAMLVLEGKGAAADAEAFRAAGIGDFKVFDFERAAKRPDGSPVEVAFSLVFASDAKAPDIGYFTCQQHHPENFWNPSFQKHPNGASTIAGVILVSTDPESHRHFFSAFTGVDDVRSSASGIALQTPRGEVAVITPKAFQSLVGIEPEVKGGARLTAVRFAVPGIAPLMAAFGNTGIAVVERNGRAVVPPDVATGATLIFEAAKVG